MSFSNTNKTFDGLATDLVNPCPLAATLARALGWKHKWKCERQLHCPRLLYLKERNQPHGFGLTVNVKWVMCELGARNMFEGKNMVLSGER